MQRQTAEVKRDIRGHPIGGRWNSGGQRQRSRCHAGHDLADSYVYRDGRRRCRRCKCAWERARYQRRNYTYLTDCVGCDDGAAIRAMIDDAQRITRATFLRAVAIVELHAVEVSLGYETHPRRGLTMAGDRYVSYHRSAYRGRPCVFFKWSAIEHIFVADGDGDPRTAYGAKRCR